MVINIPLNIPDQLLENTIAKDFEAKITENLTNEVRKIVASYDDSYIYRSGKDFNRGMECLVHRIIEHKLAEWKDEIIDAAADKLAQRLARTKKAKEVLDENL